MKPKSRQDSIVVQEIDGEILIYDLKIDKAFLLNQMSALVWNLCDGQREISTISEMLSKSTNKTVTEDFIFLAIDQLNKADLLAPMETDESFKNFNRREVIKKVGLTTTVMLPLVSFLVAPTAIDAGSVCGTVAPGATTSVGCTPSANLVSALKATCASCKYLNVRGPFGPCPVGQQRATATCCTAPSGVLICQ